MSPQLVRHFGGLVSPESGLACTVYLHGLYRSRSKLKTGQMVYLAQAYCPAFVLARGENSKEAAGHSAAQTV